MEIPMKIKKNHVWSIVLAGGDGSRMQSFIKKWLGRDIPKQFCKVPVNGIGGNV
jgi:hypothetical protein